MDSKELFRQTLAQATAAVQTSHPHHFNNATPCSDWNCRALLSHILYELSWVEDILEGKTIAQVGSKYEGDLLKDNHHQNWHRAAHKAMDAVNKSDPNTMVHLSYGDVKADDYIKEIATDLLIHSWDLGQSLQYSLIFEPQSAQTIYNTIFARKNEYVASGLFGQPQQVPKNSRLQTKLLALVGRREPKV